jgi:putative phosphoesterase
MLVGIVSDTHGGLPGWVPQAFEGCGHIIHAGDIGGHWVLDELEAVAPVTAVLGNCDHYALGGGWQPDTWALLTLEGVRIFVMHRPEDAVRALRGGAPLGPGRPLPHICVHGHTHVPRIERAGAVLMLCPGSPTNPRGGSQPSVMRLTLEPGKPPAATIVMPR